MATVKDTVLAYLQTEIAPGKRVAFDTSLTSLGFGNSLVMAGIKSHLESHFGIRIPDEMATREALDSADSITRLLSRLGVR